MTAKAKELLRQILDLSIEDRNELMSAWCQAEDEEFGPPPNPYQDDDAYEAELRRRIASVADGTAELIPWEQAREEIRAELERRRIARESGKQP